MRALALLCTVWLQLVLAGPGLHDPDCTHHQPGVTGGAGAHQVPGQGLHAHSGPSVATGESHVPVEDADEECTCSGLCVPGAVLGLSLASPKMALDLAGTGERSGPGVTPRERAFAVALPILPPSRGPPASA